MQAISNNVILKIEEKTKTDSGIILDKKEFHRNPIREGIIVSIGPKVDLEIKVGDKVLCMNNYGHTVKDPTTQEKFVVVEDEFLLAINNE